MKNASATHNKGGILVEIILETLYTIINRAKISYKKALTRSKI